MMRPPAWNASTCGTFLAMLFLGVVSIRGRRRKLLGGLLKAQAISSVLAILLFSMYAPIVAFAFVCAAFALK